MLGREGQVDKTIIRITSSHKWPEKIVYDTSLETIVPQPQVITTASVTSASPTAHDSYAEMLSPQPAAVENVKPKRRALRPSSKSVVAYRTRRQHAPAFQNIASQDGNKVPFAALWPQQ